MSASYFVGLDLAQVGDFTALAIIEREERTERRPVYAVRHLQRFPIGTAYTEIFPVVAHLIKNPMLYHPVLIVDQTGIGRAVMDLLRREVVATILPVTITGGLATTTTHGSRNVPRKDLVGCLQVLLQDRRLKIARDLPDAPLLLRELENFKIKSAAVNEGVDAWREGPHDDLVLAVALACWASERVVAFDTPPVVNPERFSVENRCRSGYSRAAERGLYGMRAR